MQTWIIDDTLPNGGGVEVVECRWQGGHGRDSDGFRRCGWGRVGADALVALGRGRTGFIVTRGRVIDEGHYFECRGVCR